MGTGCSSLDDFVKKPFCVAVLHKKGTTEKFVLGAHGGTARLQEYVGSGRKPFPIIGIAHDKKFHSEKLSSFRLS